VRSDTFFLGKVFIPIKRIIHMNVGILGTGTVGKALAKGFAAKGYDVKIGSRGATKPELTEWLKDFNGKVSVGTFSDAAKYGDILLLCSLGQVAEDVIKASGETNFDDKLLIDVTNPLDFSKGSPPGLLFGMTDSLGERVQKMLPKAKVVKCFNTVPSSQMFNPKFKDAEILICGNDAASKEQTTKILKEFGWKGSIDIGGIENSRWLEAFVPLWVRAGMALNTWDHVFSVLR
jgi:predicted dinucleotide-binding enzyme